jgi:hypothetical protein
MKGWPSEYLYAIAARVGILPMRRNDATMRWWGSEISVESRLLSLSRIRQCINNGDPNVSFRIARHLASIQDWLHSKVIPRQLAAHWMRPLSKKEGYDHRIPTNGANQPIWDNKPN